LLDLPEQYNRFVELSSGIGLGITPDEEMMGVKTGTQPLEKVLRDTLLSKLKNAPDETKRFVAKKIISAYRSAAKQQMIAEDVSRIQKLRDEGVRRGRAFRPGGTELSTGEKIDIEF